MNISNVSTQTLMRIAPKVENLIGRDIPTRAPMNEPMSPEMEAFAEIRAAIAPYQPPTQINMAQFMAARSASLRQRIANGQMNLNARPGESVGQGGFVLHDDGTFTLLNTKEEFQESVRQWQQDLLNRLMDAINNVRANGDAPPPGSFLKMTI